MTNKLFVLLPPSEGKESGGVKKVQRDTFAALLDTPRQEVRRALAELLRVPSPERLAKIFKVKGTLLERAVEAATEYVNGSPLQLRAYERYSGVVWSHLEPATLASPLREKILIPSGLYGLTTANDSVADYRLKMDVRLGGLGVLHTFWRGHLADVIGSKTKHSTLCNLLPKEHSEAIDWQALPSSTKVLNITFMNYAGDGVVGHDAKAAKGVVARHLLLEGAQSLQGFEWMGWRAHESEQGWSIRAPKARLLGK